MKNIVLYSYKEGVWMSERLRLWLSFLKPNITDMILRPDTQIICYGFQKPAHGRVFTCYSNSTIAVLSFFYI